MWTDEDRAKVIQEIEDLRRKRAIEQRDIAEEQAKRKRSSPLPKCTLTVTKSKSEDKTDEEKKEEGDDNECTNH